MLAEEFWVFDAMDRNAKAGRKQESDEDEADKRLYHSYLDCTPFVQSPLRYTETMKFLEEAPIGGKRVLVRVVADVPLKKKGDATVVADDYRLRLLLPTLHYLLDYGAKVILVSHLGRPNGSVDRDLSLRPVWAHLAGLLKHPIQFAPTITSEVTRSAANTLAAGEILALENVRFDPGEEKNTRTFASILARYADIYVDDAFAVAHHPAASNVAITELLPSYAGLLFEREVKMLSSLMHRPAKPYVAVIGGAKISDKLPAIKQLLHRADWVLVGGGVANTFLAASGVDVKKSLVDQESLATARKLLTVAKGKIVLPDDCIWSKDAMVDLGPTSRKNFARYLDRAQTIFWSGPVGRVEEPESRAGTQAIAKAITDSGATSIVGGGDTVGFVESVGLTNKFSFVSTGGGAALDYLGGQVLPAIKALD